MEALAMLDSVQCPGGALKSNPTDQRTTTNTPSLADWQPAAFPGKMDHILSVMH